MACLEIGFPKRKKVPSGRLCEPRRRVAVYLCLRRQPPGLAEGVSKRVRNAA